jgi:multimeric flavodoxin WrbA
MPETPTPHVVAVVGSPRSRGNTSLLTDAVLAELEGLGVRTTKLLLGTLQIAPCLGHDACGTYKHCTIKDDAPRVLDEVYAADGVLLATPVYYEDVTAQMKAFIDRSVFKYNHEEMLRPRVAGLLVVTAETGLEDTFASLRRFLALASDAEIPTLTLGGCADSLGVVADDEELLARGRALGAEMAAVLLADRSPEA